MDRIGRVAVATGVLVVAFAIPALAQPSLESARPLPVSPGAADRALLVDACPGFSWAPAEWAAASELAVHELIEGVLATDATLRTSVPGRATTWSPSMTECLRPGATYVWFVREVSAIGEPVGPWSPGMAFTVADPDRGAAGPFRGSSSDEVAQRQTPPRDVVIADKPPDVPPDSIQEKLDTINAKLDELLDPVSRQACIELGLELEAHFQYGGELNGEFEGRVGAEGFGNGVMGKIKADPGIDFGAQLKAGAVPKYAFCVALEKPATMAGAAGTRLVAPETVTPDELAARLREFVEKLDLSETRMAAALEAVPGFAGDGDPWASLRAGGVLQKTADVLPMPEGLRSRFENPGQIVDTFRSQLALCQQSNLPPAVADLIGEFCGLVANEPFKKLLGRVDTAVSNVEGIVNDILGQLPTASDCKFFCGSPRHD